MAVMDFVVDDRAVAGPGTHVMVVGVNSYPHEPKAGTATWKSLTSPVPTAMLFANWLLKSHKNADAPLKSLQVLLSPGPFLTHNARSIDVPRATFGNIRKAFAAGYEACKKDPGNTGIFYFCGHGCEPREICLLAEDAGEDENNPWDNFINFNLTYEAMKRNPAQSQIFILDACRDVPREMFKDEAQIGRPLMRQVIDGPAQQRDAPIFLAAGVQGTNAVGQPGGLSLFTPKLIECLEKYGASSRDGTDPWVVNTSSLREAVAELMSRQKVDQYDRTSGARSDFSLAQATKVHEIHGNCAALTNIRVAGALEGPKTALELRCDGVSTTLAAGAAPWKHELNPGSYELVATSNSHDATQTEFVQPPVRNIVIPSGRAVVKVRT